MVDLSVVIITKNQEWNIERLIISTIVETQAIPTTEIILVDSASTDRTVENAAKYPIRILRLHPDQRLTPSAGRFVGYKQTEGELILFLDGDMELFKGWLSLALVLLEQQPKIAVVSGQLIDLPKNCHASECDYNEFDQKSLRGEVVPHGGGASLYRREILEKVGTFNPYLYNDEEPELCLRIRKAGYQVYRLDYPIAFHHTEPVTQFSTLIHRWNRNLYLGYGQVIRYFLGQEMLWLYLKERGWGCATALILFSSCVSLAASVLFKVWACIFLWLLFILVFISIEVFRKHSFYLTIFSIFQRLLIMLGMMGGFFIRPLHPDTYPSRFDVIQ